MRESLMMNSVFFTKCLDSNIYVNFRIPQGVGRHRGVLDGAVSPPELIITTSQHHFFLSRESFVGRGHLRPPEPPRLDALELRAAHPLEYSAAGCLTGRRGESRGTRHPP